MTQTAWHMEGADIIVNGRRYGRGFASGLQNNCLIDAIRQQLGVAANVAFVRSELQRRFPSGPDFVSAANFLTLHLHWGAVIDLLFEADVSGKPKVNHTTFQITCVDLTYLDNGEVVGSGPAKLSIARENTNHFIPPIRKFGWSM